MVGPSSQISKILLTLLILLLMFYMYLDVSLYVRIKNYPTERGVDDSSDNSTVRYKDVTWVGCFINPLCDVTVKGLLLDHTNLYLISPSVTIIDSIVNISGVSFITPNSISYFHVFVALLSGKCVASSSLAYRRVGVLLFEFRTWLDALDGHVARVRKHVTGERSEVGAAGYYIDGLCDAIGTVALIIGVLMFLRNNPPRRGYTQLPTTIDFKDTTVPNGKISQKKILMRLGSFAFQLIICSSAWNRYIVLYQDLLENNEVSSVEFVRQNEVFRSTLFFMVAWLWRLVNFHNIMHCFLLAIFCDKLWEFLKNIPCIAYIVFLSVICLTEIHFMEVKTYVFRT